MAMPITNNVPGTLALLDEKMEQIGDSQPCQFGWDVGPGSFAVELHSQHEFSEARGGWALAIYDDHDRLIWAFPIVGRPVGGGTLRVEAFPGWAERW